MKQYKWAHLKRRDVSDSPLCGKFPAVRCVKKIDHLSDKFDAPHVVNFPHRTAPHWWRRFFCKVYISIFGAVRCGDRTAPHRMVFWSVSTREVFFASERQELNIKN